MFISVHDTKEKQLINGEKAVFLNWHDLRKPRGGMKWKFTHKEFSLLLGIVVAIIIMLTLWLKPASSESGEVSRKILPQFGTPSAKVMAEKISTVIQDSLR
jgi:hypothetical protein